MSLSSALRTELTQHLKDLYLPTIRECYPEQADKARKEDLAHERYLLELARRESEARRGNRIARTLRDLGCRSGRTSRRSIAGRLPARVHQQVEFLLEGSSLARHENVLAFCNPGSGKTHLLCAL
jgi:DNA replication protein DnaC